MWKVLAALLTVVLVIAVAGCGSGGGSQGTQDQSAPAVGVPKAADSDKGGEEAEEESEEEVEAGDAAEGATLFATACVACHGPGGEGIEGLGKDMTTSTFIAGLSDAELLAFVKTGRPVGDPLNTTGVDMPPKGGNPALSDDQILDIIAYIRSLQE